MLREIEDWIKKNGAVFILLCLFLISCAISYLGPISGDGCWHMSAAKYIAENDRIPFDEPIGRATYFWPPFLFHLTAAMFYKLSFLTDLNLIFLLLPIAYLGTLIFTYLIAKEQFNERIALFSILFLGTTPLILDFSSNYFVELFLSFFAVGSLYYTLKQRYLLGGLFFGLCIFSKLNGICMLPVLLYLIFKKEHFKIANYAKFLAAGIIGVIPYVRNYLLLGNPVWPFLNSFFGGVSGLWADRSLEFSLDIVSVIKSLVLNFLGVPHGAIGYSLERIEAIVHLDISTFVYALFALEILFVAFVLMNGLKKSIKEKWIYIIWIAGFIPMQLVYLFNIGSVDLRFFAPAYPVIAIFFGIGVDRLQKSNRLRQVAAIGMVILVSTSVMTVFAKHVIANRGWNSFSQDYQFIKENTNKEVLVYVNGQCMTVLSNRYSIPLPRDLNIRENSIIFLNDDYFVEPESSIGKEMQEDIIEKTGCRVIYSNDITKTRLCYAGQTRQ